MKIIYIHNEYAEFSGEEKYAGDMIDLLRNHGHEVVRLTESSHGSVDRVSGKIKAFFCGMYSPSSVRKTAELIDREKPDIVQIQNIYPFISPAVFSVIKKRKIPIVMCTPNYRLFCPNGLFFDRKNRICRKCRSLGWELWCVLKNCENSLFKSTGYALRNFAASKIYRISGKIDRFLVQTEFQKELFSSMGIDSEKIDVIPSMISDNSEEKKYSAGKNVSYIGRVSSEKGIEVFVKAAAMLPHIHFTVAGNYDRMEEITHNSPDNLTWLGFVSGESLNRVYENSKIVVVPSICYEGFPNTIVHAMQFKKPVIATDLGAMQAVVDDKKTGLLFKKNSINDLVKKIEQLYSDDLLCEKMGNSGYKKANKLYTKNAVYEKLMTLYNKCLHS